MKEILGYIYEIEDESEEKRSHSSKSQECIVNLLEL